eukprot:161534_1
MQTKKPKHDRATSKKRRSTRVSIVVDNSDREKRRRSRARKRFIPDEFTMSNRIPHKRRRIGNKEIPFPNSKLSGKPPATKQNGPHISTKSSKLANGSKNASKSSKSESISPKCTTFDINHSSKNIESQPLTSSDKSPSNSVTPSVSPSGPTMSEKTAVSVSHQPAPTGKRLQSETFISSISNAPKSTINTTASVTKTSSDFASMSDFTAGNTQNISPNVSSPTQNILKSSTVVRSQSHTSEIRETLLDPKSAKQSPDDSSTLSPENCKSDGSCSTRLSDLYVSESDRGEGLSSELIGAIANQHSLASGLRKFGSSEEHPKASNSKQAALPKSDLWEEYSGCHVNRRLEIYWPVERKYFSGVLRAYSRREGRYTLLYDDGDVASIRLGDAKFRWLSPYEGNGTSNPESSQPQQQSTCQSKSADKMNSASPGPKHKKRRVSQRLQRYCVEQKVSTDDGAINSASGTTLAEVINTSGEPENTKKKERRGRPKKHTRQSASLDTGSVTHPSGLVDKISKKKGRGRPRKVIQQSTSRDSENGILPSQSSEKTSKKRGRGRPRKIQTVPTVVSSSYEASGPKAAPSVTVHESSDPKASEELVQHCKPGKQEAISPPLPVNGTSSISHGSSLFACPEIKSTQPRKIRPRKPGPRKRVAKRGQKRKPDMEEKTDVRPDARVRHAVVVSGFIDSKQNDKFRVFSHCPGCKVRNLFHFPTNFKSKRQRCHCGACKVSFYTQYAGGQAELKIHEQRTIYEGNQKSDDAVYCVCQKADDGRSMVACDTCDSWFHCECVGYKSRQPGTGAPFFCKTCVHKSESSSQSEDSAGGNANVKQSGSIVRTHGPKPIVDCPSCRTTNVIDAPYDTVTKRLFTCFVVKCVNCPRHFKMKFDPGKSKAKDRGGNILDYDDEKLVKYRLCTDSDQQRQTRIPKPSAPSQQTQSRSPRHPRYNTRRRSSYSRPKRRVTTRKSRRGTHAYTYSPSPLPRASLSSSELSDSSVSSSYHSDFEPSVHSQTNSPTDIQEMLEPSPRSPSRDPKPPNVVQSPIDQLPDPISSVLTSLQVPFPDLVSCASSPNEPQPAQMACDKGFVNSEMKPLANCPHCETTNVISVPVSEDNGCLYARFWVKCVTCLELFMLELDKDNSTAVEIDDNYLEYNEVQDVSYRVSELQAQPEDLSPENGDRQYNGSPNTKPGVVEWVPFYGSITLQTAFIGVKLAQLLYPGIHTSTSLCHRALWQYVHKVNGGQEPKIKMHIASRSRDIVNHPEKGWVIRRLATNMWADRVARSLLGRKLGTLDSKVFSIPEEIPKDVISWDLIALDGKSKPESSLRIGDPSENTQTQTKSDIPTDVATTSIPSQTIESPPRSSKVLSESSKSTDTNEAAEHLASLCKMLNERSSPKKYRITEVQQKSSSEKIIPAQPVSSPNSSKSRRPESSVWSSEALCGIQLPPPPPRVFTPRNCYENSQIVRIRTSEHVGNLNINDNTSAQTANQQPIGRFSGILLRPQTIPKLGNSQSQTTSVYQTSQQPYSSSPELFNVSVPHNQQLLHIRSDHLSTGTLVPPPPPPMRPPP